MAGSRCYSVRPLGDISSWRPWWEMRRWGGGRGLCRLCPPSRGSEQGRALAWSGRHRRRDGEGERAAGRCCRRRHASPWGEGTVTLAQVRGGPRPPTARCLPECAVARGGFDDARLTVEEAPTAVLKDKEKRSAHGNKEKTGTKIHATPLPIKTETKTQKKLQLCATHGAATAAMKPSLDARFVKRVATGWQHHHRNGAVRGAAAAGL